MKKVKALRGASVGTCWHNSLFDAFDAHGKEKGACAEVFLVRSTGSYHEIPAHV